ncbi:glutamyl-tRNA reductase [Galenea microaerophila]
MKLIALGVNHETAPVEIREQVSFAADGKLKAAFEALQDEKLVSECVILSTCNRTELYCTLKNNDENHLIEWLQNFFNIKDLKPYLYLHRDLAAVQHLMRVASGLNSLILGEPQILGQLKDAYSAAHQANSIHHTLENLFQHVFRTAKQVRTDTEIGNCPISVAFASVALAKQFFGNMQNQTALLIGAGETIELVARHLKEAQVERLIIANRTLSKAHTLAEEVEGYAIELDEIPNHLHEADLVVASTASPKPILRVETVKAAMKKRKGRSVFMIDIAVPRDIEAEASQVDNVYLYTVDDLESIIEENKRARADAALAAEEIIQQQANQFVMQFRAMNEVNPIIRDFRQQAMAIKDHSLQQALKSLSAGEPAEQVLQKLANQLTNRLLHTPTQHLNQAGLKGDTQLIECSKQILLSDKES